MAVPSAGHGSRSIRWATPCLVAADSTGLAAADLGAEAHPPGYWTGSPQYGTSALAVIGAVALLIIGGLLTVISALVIAVGAGGTALLEEIDPSLIGLGGAIATAIVVVFGILLVLGILHIVAAIGVFVHKSWARWTGVVLAVLGLMLGLLMLLGSTNAPTATSGDLIVVIVWLVAYGAALIGLVAGGEHFQPRYPGR